MPKIEDELQQTPLGPSPIANTDPGTSSSSSDEPDPADLNTSQLSADEMAQPDNLQMLPSKVKLVALPTGHSYYVANFDDVADKLGPEDKPAKPPAGTKYKGLGIWVTPDGKTWHKRAGKWKEGPPNSVKQAPEVATSKPVKPMTYIGKNVYKDAFGQTWKKSGISKWHPTPAPSGAAKQLAREGWFKGKIKSSRNWFKSSPKVKADKRGWLSAELASPSGNVALTLKVEKGKEVYKLTRSSYEDYTTETVVVGELNSKIKKKKSKTAKAELAALHDVMKRVIHIYDAFVLNSYDSETGSKPKASYHKIPKEIALQGYFSKGVPLHCQCGNHKAWNDPANEDDHKPFTCKDFADAIESMRGQIAL